MTPCPSCGTSPGAWPTPFGPATCQGPDSDRSTRLPRVWADLDLVCEAFKVWQVSHGLTVLRRVT